MATTVGARDRRHNERSYVEGAMITVHTLSKCINGEEHCTEADDDEFEEVQEEQSRDIPKAPCAAAVAGPCS